MTMSCGEAFAKLLEFLAEGSKEAKMLSIDALEKTIEYLKSCVENNNTEGEQEAISWFYEILGNFLKDQGNYELVKGIWHHAEKKEETEEKAAQVHA